MPQGPVARRAPPPSAAARRAAPAPQRAPRAGDVGRASRRPRAEAAAALDERGPAAVGAYFGTAAVFDANLYWAGARLLKRLGSPAKFTSGTIDAPSYPGRAPADGGRGLALPQHRLRAGDDDDASSARTPSSPTTPTCRPSRTRPRGSASSRAGARCGWWTPAAPRRRSSRRGTWLAVPRHRLRVARRTSSGSCSATAPTASTSRPTRRGSTSCARAVERFDRGRRRPDHRPRAGRPARPPAGGAAPRPPRAADGHRHLDGAGREPDPVVRDRAPRGHRVARAAGRCLVQPGLRPGARQATGHPRPGPGAGPAEPARAAAPGRASTRRSRCSTRWRPATSRRSSCSAATCSPRFRTRGACRRRSSGLPSSSSPTSSTVT